MNKKAFIPGTSYIFSFFLVMVMVVFVMGMYDFTVVEVYEPVHAVLNESLGNLGLNTSNNVIYTEFENNFNTATTRVLPLNFLFIVVFFYSIISSLINVARSTKMTPLELIYRTVGGIIFLCYLMQLVVLKIIDYLQVELIDYLFQDLILSYIPFYNVVYENMGMIVLIWAGALVLTNWYLGKNEEVSSRGFIQQ